MKMDFDNVHVRNIDCSKPFFDLFNNEFFKGAHSDLRQFLAIESPSKVMKNVFYFTLKARFILKIFKFLSCLFGHVKKRFY